MGSEDCFVPTRRKAAGSGYKRVGAAAGRRRIDWYCRERHSTGCRHRAARGHRPGRRRGLGPAGPRHGRKPFGALLAPAIRLAADGSVVHPRVAWDWAGCERLLAQTPETAALYLHDGRALRAGEIHRQEALSATLAAIAEEGPSAFYEGEAAERMTATLAAYGGLHVAQDFAAHRGNMSSPSRPDYGGHRITSAAQTGRGSRLRVSNPRPTSTRRLGSDGPPRLHLESEAGAR